MNVHVLQFIRVHIHTHHIYLGILLENKNVCVKISNVVGTLVQLCGTPHTDTSLCSKDASTSTPSIPGTGIVIWYYTHFFIFLLHAAVLHPHTRTASSIKSINDTVDSTNPFPTKLFNRCLSSGITCNVHLFGSLAANF